MLIRFKILNKIKNNKKWSLTRNLSWAITYQSEGINFKKRALNKIEGSDAKGKSFYIVSPSF